MKVQVKIPKLDIRRETEVPYSFHKWQSNYNICERAFDNLAISGLSKPFTIYFRIEDSYAVKCCRVDMSEEGLITFTEDAIELK